MKRRAPVSSPAPNFAQFEKYVSFVNVQINVTYCVFVCVDSVYDLYFDAEFVMLCSLQKLKKCLTDWKCGVLRTSDVPSTIKERLHVDTSTVFAILYRLAFVLMEYYFATR